MDSNSPSNLPHEEKMDEILLPWLPNSETKDLVESVCLALRTPSQIRTIEQYELGHRLVSLRPTDYAGYRLIFQCVQLGVVSSQAELDRSAAIARTSSKNFQIWPHRYSLMQLLPEEDRKRYYESQERPFICDILSTDNKNYHVWNYKMSLLNLLDRLDWKEELRWVEQLLENDLLNNSYWAYRIICVKKLLTSGAITYEDEFSFVDSALLKTPANQAIWDYLKGLYDWLTTDYTNMDTNQEHRSSNTPLEELYNLVSRYTTPPVVVPAGLYLRVLLSSLHPGAIDELKQLLNELSASQPATHFWTLIAKLCTRIG